VKFYGPQKNKCYRALEHLVEYGVLL
jgi:hypothetical protein